METQITYTTGRTARARLRGSCLVMTIPRHWPRSEQQEAIAKFTRWGHKQTATLAALPALPQGPAMSLSELTELVARVNRETLNVSYAGVRIGQARYTRLAQVNLKTKILTFSKYAIDGMPERALRYLILHELSHLLVPNHSKAFWALVGTHMPDFRHQRQVAQRHFQLASSAAEPVNEPLFAAPATEPPAKPLLERSVAKEPAAPRPTAARATAPQQLRLF